MHKSNVEHCKSLEEFYKEIRSQQEAAHNNKYCLQHDEIVKSLQSVNRRPVYKELGTHQGATAAAAMLTNPASVILVDISFELFEPSRHLFEDYAQGNKIKLITKESDSTKKNTVSKCDVLLIDSFHYDYHLAKELDLHAPSVSSHIIIHDTSILHGRENDALYKVAEKFVDNINPWVITKRNKDDVGYTVLSRV